MWCQKCGSKDTKELHKNSVSKTGRTAYMCRTCANERMRKYYRSGIGKQRMRAAAKRTLQKYPERQEARIILNSLVKTGAIVKPKTCEQCRAEKRLNAHHDDYDAPADVRWVCTGCHADIHKSLKVKNT